MVAIYLQVKHPPKQVSKIHKNCQKTVSMYLRIWEAFNNYVDKMRW